MKNAFTVSPISQKIHLKPGETYRGSIKVANPAAATENFYYRTELYPYFITGDDYETDFETVSDWSRIVDWTTIENPTGVLKPNDVEKIYFTIDVPLDAPGGGQYMMLGVSSDAPFEAEEGSFSVQNIYEMASVVYVDIEGEVRHSGRIVENEIPGIVTVGKPYVLTKLNNTGNVHETAKVAITVKNNITGETIVPKEGENNEFESIVMPESTRTLKREITGLPPLGVFEVTENVSYMDIETSNSTVVVLCPVWFIILVLFTIAAIIELLFYRRHKKRKKLEKTIDLSNN